MIKLSSKASIRYLFSRNMSAAAKVQRLNPYIATHDLTFHCDDVSACYMLKSLERFRYHDIVRTRDRVLIDKADIVVDVGDVFDAEKLRLDHHQRSFKLTIRDFYPKLKVTNPNNPPRLSSSGLVYTIFGKDYITQQLALGKCYNDLDENQRKMIDCIFEKAYTEFFEEIDAIDNGVSVVSGDNIVHNYHINSGLSSRVGRLNPKEKDASPELRLENFKKAMNMVGAELSEGIKYLGTFWWQGREEIRQFVLKRKEFDPSGQIVFVESDNSSGWRSAIYDLEVELGIEGAIKFVIFNNDSEDSPWRAVALSVELKSFESRTPLKEEWRGKRGEELQEISGISDASFVHMSGFTGGAKSKEGIIKMVRKTLDLEG